jgi:hypothetical protein
MATPYTLRWLNAVMDSDLGHRAKAAAVPIFRHSDMKDGRRCFVGITRAAQEMGVCHTTMKRGLAELAQAGYLEVYELPANRRRTQGALRRPVFPTGVLATPVEAEPGYHVAATGVPVTPNLPKTHPSPPPPAFQASGDGEVAGPELASPGESGRKACAFCGDREVSCTSLGSAKGCGLYTAKHGYR